MVFHFLNHLFQTIFSAGFGVAGSCVALLALSTTSICFSPDGGEPRRAR
jgi:hypothetical protein